MELPLHHQHPLLPSQLPLSPASSADSSENSIERLRELKQQFPHGNVEQFFNNGSGHLQTGDNDDSNPHHNPPSRGGYAVTPPGAVFTPQYPPPYHHRSPPPEPVFPAPSPTNQPSSWSDYPYVSGRVSPPSQQPSFPSSSTGPWNRPSPQATEETPSADPMPEHPSEPLPAPVEPQSPGASPPESISLSSPPVPYHPHLQYPIQPPSPPQGGQQPNRTYSFVSLPGNALRKRPRRRYEEIERLYSCNYQGCKKSYGTLNHLNAHVTMQRHGPKRTPGEFKEMRKQWKRRKKELAEDDEGDPDIGPSSSGRSAKRRRRATEPVLPSVASLATSGMMGGGLGHDSGDELEMDQRQVPPLEHHHLELNRRVSMDDYAGSGDRRDSGASGDAEELIDELSDEGGSGVITLSAVGSGQSQAPGQGSGQSGGPGIHGRHGAHAESAIVSSSRAPLPHMQQSQHAGNQHMQYWQSSSHQHPSVAQRPLSPTTVTPHPSQLPGPGPVPSMAMSHHHSASLHRQPSYPPSYQPPQLQHPSYPSAPPISVPSSHHPSISYPPPVHPQSPPAPHPSQSSGVHHLVHLSPAPQPHVPSSSSTANSAAGHAQSRPQHHIQLASPPMQRLHPNSTLLTPLSSGNPHRHESIPMALPASSNLSISGPSQGGSSSGSGMQNQAHYGSGQQGTELPPVFELTREAVDEEASTSGGGGHWDSYSQTPSSRSDSYGGGIPPHPAAQRAESYSAPSREQYPPPHRPQQDMYASRGDHYSHQHPSNQPLQRPDLGQYVTPPPPHYPHRSDQYSAHMPGIGAAPSHSRQESYAPSSRGEPYPAIPPSVPSSHQDIRGTGHHQHQPPQHPYGSRGHPGSSDSGYLHHPPH